ncbi:amino acid/amide ABC transporter substrate-binding protein (HAAT family) [Phreatobacter oligotrophus]|uniref:Amino acid/amide ABC transporter substrate-binding protein (HAAT family) n=1 Tax=Phreatobacter oligotrophus TaxID=1122261 RepID=A0A2T4Z036_9HYPH|nr:substrate-binding domain-containing protein [Phreatobacter oligotrophus]PTM52857.1 amino acid/amide ABC transporter substrate-binding protein (HAAT family) [Phreatobacter oligotrophus]
MLRTTLAAAAASLVLAAAPQLAEAQTRDVKICLIAGKTGPLEAYARQTEVGFMMGLEYLTRGTNTVAGMRIQVIVKDDQLRPDRGKALLEECYNDDGAALAVGTTGSPVALAMLPVAEEAKKILIVEPAVADSITGARWNRYIFRTGRSSYQDALAAAASVPENEDVSIGMLGLDTAFGRDGVAAYKAALAAIRPRARIVAEEYAAGNTADFAPFAERLFASLRDRPGKRIIGFIWAGAHPMAKFVDMRPERFNIALAPGGNILPAMNAWKAFAGTEGGIYYYYDFPRNAQNDWLKAEYQRRHNAPPDFFVAGGFAAAAAVVAGLERAGSADTEKLIAAMAGMTFETPKGPMTFRREDHQALQEMYHFRIKPNARDNDLLELVRTIPASEMPLPITNRRTN